MTDAEKTLIEINGRLGGIEANMLDVRKALFGNGQPGMTTRLAQLEFSHQTCREQHIEEAKRKDKIFDKKFAFLAGIATIAPPILWELVKTLFIH